MTDPIDCVRPTVILPGTPEGAAALLAGSLRDVAYALRQGRGDLDGAHRLIQHAERTLGSAPRSMHAELGDALTEARAAQAERLRAMPFAGRPVPERADAPTPRQQASRLLERALVRLPTDPRAARTRIADILGGDARAGETLRGLARMPAADLDRRIADAGLRGERAELARDAIDTTVALAFHRRVVEEADRAVGALAGRLESASEGRGLDRFVEQLTTTGQQARMLAGLRRLGGGNAVEHLADLLDRAGIDPSVRARLAPDIRDAARRALESAASRTHEVRDEVRGLVHDPHGSAYALFPVAVVRAASALGVTHAGATALSTGHEIGASVLEQAVGEELRATERTRGVIEATGGAMLFAAAVGASLLSGGATLAGVCAGLATEAPENIGRIGRSQTLGVAAEAGLNSADAAEEARREAELGIAVTAAGVAIGSGVGPVHHDVGAAAAITAERVPAGFGAGRHAIHLSERR